MKKKFFVPLLTAILTLQCMMPVSAAEIPEGTATEDVTLVSPFSQDGEAIEFSVPYEETIVPEDELVGINPTTPNRFTLTGPTISGYAILNPWKYFYIYNKTGRTLYSSNVYIDGTYQNHDVRRVNGAKITYENNSNRQAVLYYKYNASTHKLLTTWSNIDDWKFLDVFPSVVDWQFEGIKFCYDNGFMQGTGDNIFDPNVQITRGMFATIVYRMAGSPSVSYRQIYPDVSSGIWYSAGITWASQNGIVKGYGNGNFGPNDTITREQAASILQRYAVWRRYNVSARADLSKFSDSGRVSSWALNEVSWAVSKGLINGKSGSRLAPGDQANRAECAAMLMRFRNSIGQ